MAVAGWRKWFDRFVLPGLAFKAVVIGGGYATGRELAEFFLPSGPVGGLMGMVLAMVIWSCVGMASFCLAFVTASRDYDTFFRNLLGPLSPICELAYVLTLILILSVFGATAGALGAALFGAPLWVGTLVLGMCIAAVVAFGQNAVEGLFKYVSIFLYAVYGLFLLLSLWRFGGAIGRALTLHTPTTGWVAGGTAYASYNMLAAVAILPVLRHLTSRRDALIAGALAGPLAMAPAIAFFLCMSAFYPSIGAAKLPSDFILVRLGMPFLRYVFQTMVFCALLEGGTAAVQSINARIGKVYDWRGWAFTPAKKLAVAALLLTASMVVADRVGLVALIAKGYRILAVVFLLIYVLPVLTFGVWKSVSKAGAAQPLQEGFD